FAGRGSRDGAPPRGAARDPLQALRARASGAGASLRARRSAAADARRGRSRLQRDARADPADRAPEPEEAARVRRGRVGPRRRLIPPFWQEAGSALPRIRLRRRPLKRAARGANAPIVISSAAIGCTVRVSPEGRSSAWLDCLAVSSSPEALVAELAE